MKLEEMDELELFKIYKNFVNYDGLEPDAPKEAKAAYNEALKRGQRKKELWEKGIRLD